AKIKTKYVCQECGYENSKWIGKCPECSNWNTFVEEIEEKRSKSNKEVFVIDKSSSRPLNINSIETIKEQRFSTCINELDRVLGGGVVKGSLVLVGGDPGIGKSTLLIQVSSNVANSGKKVLYISGEESASQIKMRAQRLGIKSDNLYIFAENNLSIIEAHLESVNPDLIIVDSIQTVFSPEITSAPGTVSQIKEGTSRFMKISKKMGISTFVVGHVTKEGALAGPKVLEHMVDTVLYFEGERFNTYRLVRAVKNRFGSTNELGVFEMREIGLVELENPSKILISEKPKDVAGSVIISTVEGTRPMLLELQALVSPTSFGIPKRTATGVDYNRVSLLMAVLEKRVGMQIQNQDVYINVVGGIKINEPSIDLGIVMSIASSFRNIPIDGNVAITGEVGLTGEIRAVSFIEKRIAECKKLGFTKIIIPKSNYEAVKDIKGREGWKNVNAVKNGQVYLIDTNSSSRPSQNVVKALKQMAEYINPDAYAKQK
ncbi:MAG: DNA repair protein RadA, partial [Peptostreptococcaceae bacterium]|nr:DNA repair protein RadA [Peptostreptococcaceae bacterium]